ncbi:MAG TPA: hypothetical protein VJ937_13180 [Salinivirga sp.]|uniref:hypothetical protein n=1 Tax=Salinivirga sp. TaxID=1970192 RepID=UPI002B49A4CA|nr:hypothetical protein [Salinivirga sp.]HKK60427.1 hypothetical protein [Salinivirga sp.]
MTRINTLVFIATFLFLIGCDHINPEEEIPVYLTIEDITVDEEYAQLTDAWVYVNEKLIGVYELPAHFPVLESGNANIRVVPGIKVNGIAVSRGPYPFYQPWEVEKNLVPGGTINLNPVTSFREDLNFQWEETFEFSSTTLEAYDSTHTTIIKTDTISDAPSSTAGAIIVEPDSTFTLQSVEQYFLPSDRDVYLELSYKTDHYFEFAWHVQNLTDGSIREARIYQFNPTDGWEHIYIYLSNFIGDYNVLNHQFRFLFGGNNITDESKHVYLDNIRLIHY